MAVSPLGGAGHAGGGKSPVKRVRDGKKCRKVYGLEQRDLWCTQCKWKKACARFGSHASNETATTTTALLPTQPNPPQQQTQPLQLKVPQLSPTPLSQGVKALKF